MKGKKFEFEGFFLHPSSLNSVAISRLFHSRGVVCAGSFTGSVKVTMKARMILCALVLLGGVCAPETSAQRRVEIQEAEAPLTNSAVIKLVRAGFRERTLVAIINSRPTRFDLSPDRLVELKKSGVSEKVILAMLGREIEGSTAMLFEDDVEMSDEEFFAGGARKSKGADGESASSGETNVFGSSGGSRGRTRSKGANGGSDSESQTSGTASVRIMRPPVEAGGGAAPRLEKTPTLTNDSVVELVEAGFSEGTIIRRIEQSPVEFDLAPAKVEELRRRRVTDQVIAAMKNAMGEEAGTTAKPEK